MKTRTGWVVCGVADQTWAYMAKPESGFGLPEDRHTFTIEPSEAHIIRATGREEAARRASAILGRKVGLGLPSPGDRRVGALAPGLGAALPPSIASEANESDAGEWLEFVRDVRAFRNGPATW